MIKVSTFLMLNHANGGQDELVSISVLCMPYEVLMVEHASFRMIREMQNENLFVNPINKLTVPNRMTYLSVEHFAQKVRSE